MAQPAKLKTRLAMKKNPLYAQIVSSPVIETGYVRLAKSFSLRPPSDFKTIKEFISLAFIFGSKILQLLLRPRLRTFGQTMRD
jgi:hypothetical protein